MSRAEHLAWCKRRALEYVDAGQLDRAVASMVSDLGKRPELSLRALPELGMLGMMAVMAKDAEGVRTWINGFL